MVQEPDGNTEILLALEPGWITYQLVELSALYIPLPATPGLIFLLQSIKHGFFCIVCHLLCNCVHLGKVGMEAIVYLCLTERRRLGY